MIVREYISPHPNPLRFWSRLVLPYESAQIAGFIILTDPIVYIVIFILFEMDFSKEKTSIKICRPIERLSRRQMFTCAYKYLRKKFKRKLFPVRNDPTIETTTTCRSLIASLLRIAVASEFITKEWLPWLKVRHWY